MNRVRADVEAALRRVVGRCGIATRPKPASAPCRLRVKSCGNCADRRLGLRTGVGGGRCTPRRAVLGALRTDGARVGPRARPRRAPPRSDEVDGARRPAHRGSGLDRGDLRALVVGSLHRSRLTYSPATASSRCCGRGGEPASTANVGVPSRHVNVRRRGAGDLRRRGNGRDHEARTSEDTKNGCRDRRTRCVRRCTRGSSRCVRR